jgi:hypothetical protein
MWGIIVEADRQQKTIWRMHIACYITKATDTHSEYVILIVFHFDDLFVKTLQCFVISTLSISFVY